MQHFLHLEEEQEEMCMTGDEAEVTRDDVEEEEEVAVDDKDKDEEGEEEEDCEVQSRAGSRGSECSRPRAVCE